MGSQKIAEILLRYGANLDIQNESGQTPYQLAMNRGQFEIASFLYKWVATQEMALRKVLERGGVPPDAKSLLGGWILDSAHFPERRIWSVFCNKHESNQCVCH